MTSIVNNCQTCKWFLSVQSCHAFIDKIPDKIWYGENDHINKYRGDRGVQYEEVRRNDKSN
jgi:hypothetical protein